MKMTDSIDSFRDFIGPPDYIRLVFLCEFEFPNELKFPCKNEFICKSGFIKENHFHGFCVGMCNVK